MDILISADFTAKIFTKKKYKLKYGLQTNVVGMYTMGKLVVHYVVLWQIIVSNVPTSMFLKLPYNTGKTLKIEF